MHLQRNNNIVRTSYIYCDKILIQNHSNQFINNWNDVSMRRLEWRLLFLPLLSNPTIVSILSQRWQIIALYHNLLIILWQHFVFAGLAWIVVVGGDLLLAISTYPENAWRILLWLCEPVYHATAKGFARYEWNLNVYFGDICALLGCEYVEPTTKRVLVIEL